MHSSNWLKMKEICTEKKKHFEFFIYTLRFNLLRPKNQIGVLFFTETQIEIIKYFCLVPIFVHMISTYQIMSKQYLGIFYFHCFFLSKWYLKYLRKVKRFMQLIYIFRTKTF